MGPAGPGGGPRDAGGHPRDIRQHQGPFREAFKASHRFNGHLCRLAEGQFGGFFGRANLTLRSAGGYMGMTAGPGDADRRAVDLYRREGDRLAENWIFIDHLHLLAQLGSDPLAALSGT